MDTRTIPLVTTPVSALAPPAGGAGDGASSRITVRTENFPRPPYSEATDYVHESEGRTVCTKLAVCTEYDRCRTRYGPGVFRAPEDSGAGRPYAATSAAVIAAASLSKHVCLTRFGLAPRR